MMHGPEKSDSAIVAKKSANKAASAAAERAERRAGTEGNAEQSRTQRTQCRASVSPGLDRVRDAARQRKKEKFTALLHHVTVDLMRDAFLALKRRAAPGVDGVTWQDYEAGLEGNLQELHARVHRGTYRALPVRRKFIPKPGINKQRPLGIAALEDKIVQRAVVMVLNAIYEEDFLGFSYGFRPARGQHDALDALSVAIGETRVNWILDADIRSFFDGLSQEWLVRFWSIESATSASSALCASGSRRASWKTGSGASVRGGLRKGRWYRRFLQTSTCTTSSISGPSNGGGEKLPAT